jgi:hypothetical protein
MRQTEKRLKYCYCNRRGNGMKNQTLFRRSQPFPRTTESQLNPKRCGDENVDFPGLNFLKISRGNFSALGQFILRQPLAYPLPAHVGTKDLDSLPFFLGNGHDILHRFLMVEMNDTYIVKRFWILLAMFDARLRISIRTRLAGFNFSGTTAIFNRINKHRETT